MLDKTLFYDLPGGSEWVGGPGAWGGGDGGKSEAGSGFSSDGGSGKSGISGAPGTVYLNHQPGYVDLVIADVWIENSTIYYKIRNTGDRAGESKTNLTIDGVFKASDYVAPLEPEETRTKSFNYTWTCKTNKSDEIKVCADYEDDVEEGNEENNYRTETWSCLPDLKITDVYQIVSLRGRFTENVRLLERFQAYGSLELVIPNKNESFLQISLGASSEDYFYLL